MKKSEIAAILGELQKIRALLELLIAPPEAGRGESSFRVHSPITPEVKQVLSNIEIQLKKGKKKK